MKFENEGFARLDHLAIAVVVLFGKGYFESKNRELLGHSYMVSAKGHGDGGKKE